MGPGHATTTPSSRIPIRRIASAAATSARSSPSRRWPTASRRSRVGGEPDQWLALQLATDALADAGYAELPADIRARTGVMLGKGTYLNGGNAIAVQRGLIVEQTLSVLARLHPEHTPEQLEQLRAEMQRVLPAIGPETVAGLIPNIIVGRIANRLDLMGPSYTVDAACASSLVAVQHADHPPARRLL